MTNSVLTSGNFICHYRFWHSSVFSSVSLCAANLAVSVSVCPWADSDLRKTLVSTYFSFTSLLSKTGSQYRGYIGKAHISSLSTLRQRFFFSAALSQVFKPWGNTVSLEARQLCEGIFVFRWSSVSGKYTT